MIASRYLVTSGKMTFFLHGEEKKNTPITDDILDAPSMNTQRLKITAVESRGQETWLQLTIIFKVN